MSETARSCPTLLIAAPASRQGKTTVTAALARLHARAGRRVRVFKCGPDFFDPRDGDGTPGEALWRRGSLAASYCHAWFPSNWQAAARLFLAPPGNP